MKTTFLKKYLMFYVSVLLVVIPLELIFSPNHRVAIAEYGWGYFIRNSLVGMGILVRHRTKIWSAVSQSTTALWCDPT